MKVVRSSLPPGISWYSFLEAQSTPGHMELSDAREKIPRQRAVDTFMCRVEAQSTPGHMELSDAREKIPRQRAVDTFMCRATGSDTNLIPYIRGSPYSWHTLWWFSFTSRCVLLVKLTRLITSPYACQYINLSNLKFIKNKKKSFFKFKIFIWGARCWWRSWLRHCTTRRKVVSSIPDGVIAFFHWHNTSVRTMALGLTQPLTEMSTRNISWRVKVAGA